MRLLRTPEHREQGDRLDAQRRERHRRFPRRRGLVVDSAEETLFANSERPLPREEEAVTVAAELGAVVSTRNFEVNYFTTEEVSGAIDNVVNGRVTGERRSLVVGDRTYTVQVAPYTSHDVEVYHTLRNPDALNFVETDDGLRSAPRLP